MRWDVNAWLGLRIVQVAHTLEQHYDLKHNGLPGMQRSML